MKNNINQFYNIYVCLLVKYVGKLSAKLSISTKCQ